MIKRTAAIFGAVALCLVASACGITRADGRFSTLDVNGADRAELARLPGLDGADADQIVANRPYMEKDDLVSRNILSRRQYEAVADRLYVGPPGMPDYLESVPPMPEGP